QQANGNGSTSNFYLAGSRSELVDALGNRHVTYQTDRGKVIKDAVVLGAGFGNVFNDTVQQNGVVNVAASQYDGLDRLTLTTSPEGGTTAYAYAIAVNPWANNVASITRTPKPGSPLSPLVTSFTYDPTFNKPTSITDPLGLIASMSYDQITGNRLSVVTDVGAPPHFNATTRFTYDPFGQVATVTDALGTVTAYTYDQFENRVSQVADSGAGRLNATTLFGYDPIGNLVSQRNPNGNTTTMAYDANRRLLVTTAPPSGTGLVQTTNTYDPDGHVLTVTRTNVPANVVTTTTYTATGQLQSITDPNNRVTTSTYDAADRVVAITDPLLRITSFGY